jgi:hypothetical protein
MLTAWMTTWSSRGKVSWWHTSTCGKCRRSKQQKQSKEKTQTQVKN